MESMSEPVVCICLHLKAMSESHKWAENPLLAGWLVAQKSTRQGRELVFCQFAAFDGTQSGCGAEAVTQMTHLIMVAQYTLVLTLDDGSDGLWQQFIQCLAITGFGHILAALAC